MNDAEWLKDTQRRAAFGNADAQIALAWEHIKGRLVEKNVARAISLFREAESQKPRIARFNLAKAKILEGDPSFQDDIREDCSAGFGPALWLMGISALRRMRASRGEPRQEALDEALRYLRLGAEKGHFPSEAAVWRYGLSPWKRFWSLESVAQNILRWGRVWFRNERDERVLT
jgi:TPR repeat protein